MQPTSPTRVPKYRLHNAWGLGVVRINGKDIYLGKHGTPEGQAEYRRVVAEWLAVGGLVTPGERPSGSEWVNGLTINELVLGLRDILTLRTDAIGDEA